MKQKKPQRFPIRGYLVIFPSRRIVKVKIDKIDLPGEYPYRITSLEFGTPICEFGSVKSETFGIVKPEQVKLYPSREKAFKYELNKLHDEYRDAKRALRKAEQMVKWANNRVFEYKNFEEIHSLVFNQS